MSSGIDIQFVRESYQKLSYQDLIRTVTQNAKGLTPEALEVVKEEVKRRKLDTGIPRSVDAQQKTYTMAEIDTYCNIIRDLPCPATGGTSEKLYATLTAEVMSFLLFTNYRKKIVVGSPAALHKANNAALTKSVILGWWGFPWGVVRTIEAIAINTKNKTTNSQDGPNNFLRSFVLSNIGQIEA